MGNKRTGRGARLVLPLTPPWNDGNLCLSFRHNLAGHHVGMLQVFVKKGKQYSPAVWGRTGGNGWRHTQITLWGTGLESVSSSQLFGHVESNMMQNYFCLCDSRATSLIFCPTAEKNIQRSNGKLVSIWQDTPFSAVHQVILKGERGRGRSGEMAVDDISLTKGTCTEEHNLRRL